MADNEFRIQSESPAAGDLMFWCVVGHEGLSRPSTYELTVLSAKERIEPADILGHGFAVVMEFLDADKGKQKRHFQGIATRFSQGTQAGRYFQYRILLKSWFGLLTQRINARIQQDKKALEVFDAVLEDSAIKAVKKTGIDGVTGKHAERRYCVQYMESDYRFLSRLLEDEGVYYWFDAHDAPGTMHLSDSSDVAHDKLPVTDTLRLQPPAVSAARFNEIVRWIGARQLGTGKFDSRDSDFKAIRKKLEAAGGEPDSYELADFEAFEFAGGYFAPDDMDGKGRLRGEELGARRARSWALTHWPDVAVGKSFTFEDLPEGQRDGDYLIATCTFVVSHAGYEGLTFDETPESVERLMRHAMADDAVNAEQTEAFAELARTTPELQRGVRGNSSFLITVLPLDVPFRPPRLTPRTPMPGPQSAIVVGPSGDELHVDDFGRVKVHFHWDRYDKSNEKSTCWVRVSQPWAGKGWGGYFIPRIGQEVIVDFLNGDPDRPIIIGRVYNDDQPIPFTSPTQSGFRTRSTPKGTAANCNEFRFEDKKGAEQVYLHAEKNQDIEVENDETHWVGHDRSKTIDHDETTLVKHDRTETVDNNETITVHGHRTETVDKNETITIHQNRTETVDQNEKITIHGARIESVDKDESITIHGGRTEKVDKNETITIDGARTETVAKDETITINGGRTEKVAKDESITIGGGRTEKVGKDESIAIGGGRTESVAKDEGVTITGARTVSVGKDDKLSVGKNLVITAADSISITTGSASITMKKDGTIVIKGKDITVEGSGKINVKASSDIVMKGSKILQN